ALLGKSDRAIRITQARFRIQYRRNKHAEAGGDGRRCGCFNGQL
ncbi:MAG: hypothetical protein AVDCRST_MAG93-8433, partial [uncultured Chloroflexia bacterium]